MGNRVSLAAGVLVAISVFTWLAGPLLETQFGTGALITTYAALAMAAGAMTYVLVSSWNGSTESQPAESEAGNVQATIEIEETEIDDEIKQLKDTD